MKLLILGSTGLLGGYVMRHAHETNRKAVGVARSNADLNIDVTDPVALNEVLYEQQPDVIINCAGLVSIDGCERNRFDSWAVNVAVVAHLARWASENQGKLIQISTDQFVQGHGKSASSEHGALKFHNVYAAHKFAGEQAALLAPASLVVRGAITGRGLYRDVKTFWTWACQVIDDPRGCELFIDAYTSLIDAATFARALFALIDDKCAGIINVGSSEVFSKRDFVLELARQRNVETSKFKEASIASLEVPRGSALGLDSSFAQSRLDFELPNLCDVVANLLEAERKK